MERLIKYYRKLTTGDIFKARVSLRRGFLALAAVSQWALRSGDISAIQETLSSAATQ